VIIGASVGFTLFLMQGSSETESEAEPVVKEEVRLPAMYLDLKPAIVVTYSYKGKQRFIQASLNVMARNQETLDAVDLHGPVIRNRLINLYGGKDFEALQTHEGRIGLLEETRTTINTILQEQKVAGEVEAVLFQNLVLQ
jgi:flagellar FliL protein